MVKTAIKKIKEIKKEKKPQFLLVEQDYILKL